MRKLLILLIILGSSLNTALMAAPSKNQGPIMLEPRSEREAWAEKMREQEKANQSIFARIYNFVMARLGLSSNPEENRKNYRKDIVPEVFVQDNCSDCLKLQHFFEDSKMPFIRYDINRDLKGAQIYHSLGMSSMPLTRVGTTVVKGYDPQRIEVLMAP